MFSPVNHPYRADADAAEPRGDVNATIWVVNRVCEN